MELLILLQLAQVVLELLLLELPEQVVITVHLQVQTLQMLLQQVVVEVVLLMVLADKLEVLVEVVRMVLLQALETHLVQPLHKDLMAEEMMDQLPIMVLVEVEELLKLEEPVQVLLQVMVVMETQIQ